MTGRLDDFEIAERAKEVPSGPNLRYIIANASQDK